MLKNPDGPLLHFSALKNGLKFSIFYLTLGFLNIHQIIFSILPFGTFLTSILFHKNITKTERGPLETFKKYLREKDRRESHSGKKYWKAKPFSLFRFCMLR